MVSLAGVLLAGGATFTHPAWRVAQAVALAAFVFLPVTTVMLLRLDRPVAVVVLLGAHLLLAAVAWRWMDAVVYAVVLHLAGAILGLGASDERPAPAPP